MHESIDRKVDSNNGATILFVFEIHRLMSSTPDKTMRTNATILSDRWSAPPKLSGVTAEAFRYGAKASGQ